MSTAVTPGLVFPSKTATPSSEAVSLSGTRQHQTAVFVRLSADVSSAVRNRVNRLSESLNGSNIKVDYYTVNTDVANPSDDALRAAARGVGYTLALIADGLA